MLAQDKLFVGIETAVTEARISLGNCDAADCVDWLVTVQLKTAELSATLMSRIQTMPGDDYNGLRRLGRYSRP